MDNVLLIVNHVQSGYLDQNDPDDVALRQKILDFVEEARPHVNKIAWSYAMKDSLQGLPFNIATERPETFQKDADLTLTNNDGKGLDSNFLQKIFDESPGHVILVGVYFEACSAGTAKNIKQNIGIKVSVPMDMTNPAEPPFKDFYDNVAKDLQASGIDVKTPSAELLEQIKAEHTQENTIDEKPRPALDTSEAHNL